MPSHPHPSTKTVGVFAPDAVLVEPPELELFMKIKEFISFETRRCKEN
jgi:hypothetical protein